MAGHLITLIVAVTVASQISPRMASLVEALRPALPYPASTPSGDLPADNSAETAWFVVWPDEPEDTQIIVRANPLNEDVQAASAAAMEEINAAVAAAERRAQASYDRALEQLRRTGRAGDLENVTLDDEGVAGERIDAELEVTIEMTSDLSFDIASDEAPVVHAGSNGVAWVVGIPEHTYRDADEREHFRAAERRVYFGEVARPTVSRLNDTARYRVSVPPAPDAFAVVIRGNSRVVADIESAADWARLAPR